jgi:hypothetical protein
MQSFDAGESKVRHPFGRADLEIGAPIWIRDRLEALSYFCAFCAFLRLYKFRMVRIFRG